MGKAPFPQPSPLSTPLQPPTSNASDTSLEAKGGEHPTQTPRVLPNKTGHAVFEILLCACLTSRPGAHPYPEASVAPFKVLSASSAPVKYTPFCHLYKRSRTSKWHQVAFEDLWLKILLTFFFSPFLSPSSLF